MRRSVELLGLIDATSNDGRGCAHAIAASANATMRNFMLSIVLECLADALEIDVPGPGLHPHGTAAAPKMSGRKQAVIVIGLEL